MRDDCPGDRRTRSRAIGTGLFGVTLAASGVVLYAWLTGRSGGLVELGRVRPRYVGALLVAAFSSILLWGLSLRVVLAAVDIGRSARTAVLLFLASVFMNGVTPFGQAGGDPPTGFLIARVENAEFEYGLAAITGVNALNRLGVVVLGAVGAAWLGVRVALPKALREPVSVAIVISLGVGVVVALGWKYRERLVGVAGDAVATLVVGIGGRVPFVTPPTRESVVERMRRFVTAIERLEAQPRRIAAASLLGIAGHVAVVGVLWLALAALGVRASPAVVLVVVPVAKLSGLTPTPGGMGSAEALLSGLLIAATGVAVPIAAAAALLYRATAFWLPTVAGGVVTAWLFARSGRS